MSLVVQALSGSSLSLTKAFWKKLPARVAPVPRMASCINEPSRTIDPVQWMASGGPHATVSSPVLGLTCSTRGGTDPSTVQLPPGCGAMAMLSTIPPCAYGVGCRAEILASRVRFSCVVAVAPLSWHATHAMRFA
jgi:hypothetical protein